MKKNKEVIGLMKEVEKAWKNTVLLRGKIYSNLKDHGSKDKKAKGTKTCVINRKLNFENIKNCLEVTQIENKTKHFEKKKMKMTQMVLKKIIKNS